MTYYNTALRSSSTVFVSRSIALVKYPCACTTAYTNIMEKRYSLDKGTLTSKSPQTPLSGNLLLMIWRATDFSQLCHETDNLKFTKSGSVLSHHLEETIAELHNHKKYSLSSLQWYWEQFTCPLFKVMRTKVLSIKIHSFLVNRSFYVRLSHKWLTMLKIHRVFSTTSPTLLWWMQDCIDSALKLSLMRWHESLATK